MVLSTAEVNEKGGVKNAIPRVFATEHAESSPIPRKILIKSKENKGET
jgi:hypothetical protein